MSRKFKVWDKKENQWFIKSEDLKLFIDEDGYLCGYLWDIEKGWNETDIDQNRYIIVWYTNLKDKQTKDIYEGDVIKIRDQGEELYIIENYETFFRDSGYYEGEMVEDWSSPECLEIIGNIYENPELLK